MSSGSPSSGGRIQALVTLLVAIAVPPAALLPFAHVINPSPWFALISLLIYEMIVFVWSLLTEIWQKLKAPWIEAIADWVDQRVRSALSHYYHHYCRYFTYEHRYLDMKGMTTQDAFSLELEHVFIELRLDSRAPHETSADPLRLPAQLRSGSHSIWEYLQARPLRDEHLVLLGAPGSGKTTLLKHLGLALIHHKLPRGVKRFPKKLPVLLSLREHSSTIKDQKNYSLVEAVQAHVRTWKRAMPAGWIEHRLTRGQCLILLDGLDEVADPALRQQTVDWVGQQMIAYGNNRFVLTSRPFGYRNNPLPTVTILEVQPFTFEQTTQFVKSWYHTTEIKNTMRDDAGVRIDAEKGAHDLLRRLRETPALLALAVNPLLLTMIATVHRYRGTLPGARIELYKEICDVFLGKRQAARGLPQDLRSEQRQFVLQPLAYQMMLRGVRAIASEHAEQVIASPLQQVSPALAPKDFLQSVEQSSGLLLERESDIYSFAHLTFQEYLAAAYIREQGLEETLTTRVASSWWHETIRLYSAQADATPIITACLSTPSIVALTLALECQYEARNIQAAAQQRLQTTIDQGIEHADPERRRITSEALLTRRLRRFYALTDQVGIDTSLITHAEYQLFLDEQRRQAKYYQPDHWQTFSFAPGTGHQPVLGVRRVDASAFCDWLSLREQGARRYRLPRREEVQQVDKQLWKQLSPETGYWVDGVSPFVWSHEQSPQSFQRVISAIVLHGSARDFDRDLAGALARVDALDLARASALALALARDFDRAGARALARDFDLARADASEIAGALDLAGALVDDLADALARASARARDLDLAGALARAGTLARALALARDFDRARAGMVAGTLARDFARALARDLDRSFELFTLLLLLQARQTGRFPAYEGILLAREQQSP